MNKVNQKLIVKIGIAGIVPFALITFACWVVHPEWLGYLINAQLYYGIAILSFLGGLHWGVALLSDGADDALVRRALLWGVMPTLIAWFSMVRMEIGFLVQIGGFIAAYRADKRLYQACGVPEWFLQLRLHMTRVVVGILIFTLIAANVRP